MTTRRSVFAAVALSNCHHSRLHHRDYISLVALGADFSGADNQRSSGTNDLSGGLKQTAGRRLDQPERLPLDLALEAHISADRSSIAYRRGLKRMGLGQFFIV